MPLAKNAYAFKPGARLMKELQMTLFFSAYDEVSKTKSKSMKEQMSTMKEYCFGTENPDYVTLTEQFVAGVNQFSGLYKDRTTEINSDVNASADRSPVVKQLKNCFFPQKTSTSVRHEVLAGTPNGITATLLTCKCLSNSVDITEQTMYSHAKKVLQNGKKALACVLSADSEYKNGTFPTGRTMSDYHRYVREQMYVVLKGTTGGGNNDDNGPSPSHDESNRNTRAVINASDMPEDYWFEGMIAFFLWGPIVDETMEAFKTSLFKTGGEEKADGPGPNNRSQARIEEASQSAAKRDVGAATTGCLPLKRGSNMTQQIELAKLQLFHSSQAIAKIDSKYQLQFTMLENSIESRMRMITQLKVTDESHSLWIGLKELVKKSEALQAEYATKRANAENQHSITEEVMRSLVPSNKRACTVSLVPSAASVSTMSGLSANSVTGGDDAETNINEHSGGSEENNE